MVPSVAELIVASVDNVSAAPHPRQDTGHDTNSSKVLLLPIVVQGERGDSVTMGTQLW